MIIFLMLMGCSLFINPGKAANEIIITSYEAGAYVGFNGVKAYLAQKVINGTLAGDSLTAKHTKYATTKTSYVTLGDNLVLYMNAPQAALLTNIQGVVTGVGAALADLSDGKLKQVGPRMKYVPHPQMKMTLRATQVSPEMISFAIDTLLGLIEILANYTGSLTADDKLAYQNRIQMAQKAIPDWV